MVWTPTARLARGGMRTPAQRQQRKDDAAIWDRRPHGLAWACDEGNGVQLRRQWVRNRSTAEGIYAPCCSLDGHRSAAQHGPHPRLGVSISADLPPLSVVLTATSEAHRRLQHQGDIRRDRRRTVALPFRSGPSSRHYGPLRLTAAWRVQNAGQQRDDRVRGDGQGRRSIREGGHPYYSPRRGQIMALPCVQRRGAGVTARISNAMIAWTPYEEGALRGRASVSVPLNRPACRGYSPALGLKATCGAFVRRTDVYAEGVREGASSCTEAGWPSRAKARRQAYRTQGAIGGGKQ
ncbi:hypothetical protein BJ912DRAFT_963416 [Pholiota molesta]|nr:hypothetical protein BJ912DRAFT_963416 [Pholiota molesta]